MPIKSVKRNRRRTVKRQRGGSSASLSSSVLSSAYTTIKRSLGVKRVTDKNCNKEIGKLRQIFSQIKTGYMTLEKEHKSQMNQSVKKYRELTTEMRSARVNTNRVSIREEAYTSRVQNINALRENMNELFILFKNLRCVLIKYLFTKLPENLAPVFEEYSTLFTVIKDKLIGSSKSPVDLALIKECLTFYLENKDKKNTDFIHTIRRDILRISPKQFSDFNSNSGAKLVALFTQYCKKDAMDDEIFEGHHIKFHEQFQGDLDKSTVVESVSATNVRASGKRKRKIRRSKKRKMLV